VRYRRPTKLPAPEYVDALMNWAQNILDDETVFPSKPGVPFPPKFRDTVRTIVRRLFRVYAHIYSNHFDQICALGIEGALLTWAWAMLTETSAFEHELSSLFLVRSRGGYCGVDVCCADDLHSLSWWTRRSWHHWTNLTTGFLPKTEGDDSDRTPETSD